MSDDATARAKRRGLGRGLGALLEAAEGASAPAPVPVTRLPADRLMANPRQPRAAFDDEGLEELARSIRAQGLVQPLVVTPGPGDRYLIVAGERRFRAAQRAGLAELPVVVRAVAGERELLALALVENLQRQDLNPLEEADAYRQLAEEFGLSQEDIGREVGKSRVAIANSLRLLRLPGEVQALLRDGHLTAGQARPLLSIADPAAQLALARRARDERLTARQVERLAGAPPAAAPRPPRSPDVHTAHAEERLTRALQTRVTIRRRGSGGAVEIEFYSEEELMRLFDLLLAAGGRR